MVFLRKIVGKVTPPKVNLDLKLNRSIYVLGEKVEGKLAASSSEDFDADDIRCEFPAR